MVYQYIARNFVSLLTFALHNDYPPNILSDPRLLEEVGDLATPRTLVPSLSRMASLKRQRADGRK
ncbi:hypothetical protein NUACC26_031620 [Scytonema sp. NUACC26]